MTYDDIDGLVKIDDHTVIVDDWDSRYSTFGEHMNDVENRGIESCSGYRPIRSAYI